MTESARKRFGVFRLAPSIEHCIEAFDLIGVLTGQTLILVGVFLQLAELRTGKHLMILALPDFAVNATKQFPVSQIHPSF